MVVHTGGYQAEHSPRGLRRRDFALATQTWIDIGVRRFTPAAVGLLMSEQPVCPGDHHRIVVRNSDRGQASQRLPRAVDIVDAPTAEPAAVGFLRRAQVSDATIN